jgi:hypothetical protein
MGRLPVDEQLDALQAVLSRNAMLVEVLVRAGTLNLPNWYVAAGGIVQTVWNVVTDRPPAEGIKDYDLGYFDSSDLSWEAEDAAIQAGQTIFTDLPIPVEIRNQARVHLWYEDKFGVRCPPHTCVEAAIDSFEATTCCLGVRVEPNGRWRVYAPHGLSDVFNLVVRPNPVLAPRSVYQAKISRWRQQWATLTVLPWPEPGPGPGPGPGAEPTAPQYPSQASD